MSERRVGYQELIEERVTNGLGFRRSFVNHNPKFSENMLSLQLHLGEMVLRTRQITIFEAKAANFTHQLLLQAHIDGLENNTQFETPEEVAEVVDRFRKSQEESVVISFTGSETKPRKSLFSRLFGNKSKEQAVA